MIKQGMALAGAAGVGTTSYLGYSLMHKIPKAIKEATIGEEWSEFILVNGTDEQWESRKTKLSKALEDQLIPEIKAFKSDKDGLKRWCEGAAKKTYSDMKPLYLSNVRSYCTIDFKDKLGGKHIGSSDSWEEAKDKLKKVTQGTELSEEMKEVKSQLSDALKTWCLSAYDRPYLNEQDRWFKDTKDYCTKNGARR
ncbi:hypothetical protein MHF_0401 [Mycoplasma haemofelis Ohio2]|uniref:Uncharacterized protein n=1 Tax=Mycoplasma haemofelis (strain Ohio2) TaxID=859194 RepID=F6FH72_MYCHI|nr:hypothetical protein MHF_0401 [Mycoplasma haemofelis Ohio2]